MYLSYDLLIFLEIYFKKKHFVSVWLQTSFNQGNDNTRVYLFLDCMPHICITIGQICTSSLHICCTLEYFQNVDTIV